MRQRNFIIHYPGGIMNNRNNGYFGALFIIHFFYTQNEPPTHTHHHHHHHHHPKTNSTPLFGIPHPRVRSQTSRFGSGPSCPSRVPIPTARPTRPNRVCARPEGFSSQSAPAWSPVSRPSQPAADRPRRPELSATSAGRACCAFHARVSDLTLNCVLKLFFNTSVQQLLTLA